MLFIRLLLITFIALGTFLILNVTYAAAEDKEISVSPIPNGAVAGASTSTPVLYPEAMNQTIAAALNGTTGTYAVVVKDLSTGTAYTSNADHTFATASLYKLWVMTVTYQQIAEGKFDEDTKMSDTVENLNKTFGIASESAELKEGGISLTVGDALNKMITISDNYAAFLLTKKIKASSMKSFLETNGLKKSKQGPDPTTTASDIALFLEKLYRGELGTAEHTQKMLDLLAKQQLNDRIPKYLPEDLTIMHKTGELDGVKHDVGIVRGLPNDYIIVLMSDTKDPKAAAEREANISKNVYEYLVKNM